MKRLLLTGASGFIGRFAIEPLTARGFEVHAVDLRVPAHPDDRAEWHACNLLNPAETDRVMEDIRPSHLLHFAWYAVPGKFWTAPENLDWVAASAMLARAFARVGGQRFVAAGSCAEYAASDTDCDERSTPVRPETLYGTCKHAFHQVLAAFAAGRFSYAWGRIFHLYGPHELESRLVPSVIRALLAGEDALCTAGTQVRDFMDVRDVAGAFAALSASDVEGPVNVASGVPVTVADLAGRIGRRMNAADRVRLGARPIPAGEAPRLTASVARLRNDVGWSPARDLDRGLDETIEWWRQRMSR